MKTTVIVTAAGSGSRMNLGYNKMLYQVAGQTILEKTVSHFINDADIEQIIVTSSDADYAKYQTILTKLAPHIQIVKGGNTRQDSVYAALKLVKTETVFIHDGARPNLSSDLIRTLKLKLEQGVMFCIPAVAVNDTINVVENNQLVEILERDKLKAIQTPQVGNTKLLQELFSKASKENKQFTDESSLLFNYGYDVVVIDGDVQNVKITTKKDLRYL